LDQRLVYGHTTLNVPDLVWIKDWYVMCPNQNPEKLFSLECLCWWNKTGASHSLRRMFLKMKPTKERRGRKQRQSGDKV